MDHGSMKCQHIMKLVRMRKKKKMTEHKNERERLLCDFHLKTEFIGTEKEIQKKKP